jgi:hypothetical protein
LKHFAFPSTKIIACLNKAVILKTEHPFDPIYYATEIDLKTSNKLIKFREKGGEHPLNTFVNMFNFGVYMLIFLMAVITVFAVIWAKYSK